MKHIELHILQSFPVSCLNRDDLNSPKTATFGNVQRARVSSQCWKRAVRELLTNEKESDCCSAFKGKRGRWVIGEFESILREFKEPEGDARALAICAGHYLAKIDAKNTNRVKTSLFISPLELNAISKCISALKADKKKSLIDAVGKINLSEAEDDLDEETENEVSAIGKKDKSSNSDKMTAKQFTKLIEKVLKPVFSELYKNDDLKGLPKDAADIAIFGRMVANDPSLNKEGAAAFNHALSVHKVDSEIEYFSAVDEMQPKEETGAAITGTFEFNSATYYRFATLNLDLLFDKDHLACFESKERKEIVKAFVKAMVQAIPVARRNSMNGNVAPSYVLCVIREKGHPIQLVNAFEEPIQNEKGILKESIEKLKKEYACLKERWDLDEKTKYEIPDGNLKGLLAEVEKHVK